MELDVIYAALFIWDINPPGAPQSIVQKNWGTFRVVRLFVCVRLCLFVKAQLCLCSFVFVRVLFEHVRTVWLPTLKNRGSILQHWRKRESLYPTLAKMAKDVLACPASSAPSERQFSLSGNTQTKKRNRISAQTLETMVLLRNWQTNKFFK